MTVPRAIAFVVLLSYGCAGTVDVRGGPYGMNVQVSKQHLLENIEPLVAGDPAAAQRVDEIKTRERRAKVLLYGQLGLLAGCLAVNSNATGYYNSTGIGLCLGSIALGIATLIVHPKQKTYGEPLRVYNRNNPTTRYVAPELGVE